MPYKIARDNSRFRISYKLFTKQFKVIVKIEAFAEEKKMISVRKVESCSWMYRDIVDREEMYYFLLIEIRFMFSCYSTQKP